MAGKSEIEWTEYSWNPIVGCSIVSPGCTHCYAMTMAHRLEAMAPDSPTGHLGHYLGTTKKVGHAVWTGRVARAPEHVLLAPLHWKTPRRIFVNSMGDLFHESISDEWIDDVFAIMALCPHHTFQVLTKRAARMAQYFNGPYPNGNGVMARIADATWKFAPTRKQLPVPPIAFEVPVGPRLPNGEPEFGWRRFLKVGPLKNVWLGVSAERQTEADERIPHLLSTPAAVRFVSCEPLLGPIDLVTGGDVTEVGHINWLRGFDGSDPPIPKLDWVIVGGESGHNARPMNPQWARDIRDHCAAASVAFFHKQNGEFASVSEIEGPGRHHTFEDGRTVRRVGKNRAGRLLDGVEHNGFPEARQ